MIQSICLTALATVVVVRAPASWRKPAWWATAFGAVSIATYGVLWASPNTMDAILGSRNLLTLVRDTSGIAAMWFFHNAVAAQRGHPEKKLHTRALCVALAAVAIPFMFIPSPGPTSENFILDRLSQISTWMFATIYISLMGVIAARVLSLLVREKSVMTIMYMSGMSLMVIGSVIELAYLCIAHFMPASSTFRETYYYASQPPFFTGVLLSALGFAWVFGLRMFWKYVARWTVGIVARACDAGTRITLRERVRTAGWSDRQLALDSAVNVRDRLKTGAQQLSKVDILIFTWVEWLLSLHVERSAA